MLLMLQFYIKFFIYQEHQAPKLVKIKICYTIYIDLSSPSSAEA
jgi:hypothetical protein